MVYGIWFYDELFVLQHHRRKYFNFCVVSKVGGFWFVLFFQKLKRAGTAQYHLCSFPNGNETRWHAHEQRPGHAFLIQFRSRGMYVSVVGCNLVVVKATEESHPDLPSNDDVTTEKNERGWCTTAP